MRPAMKGGRKYNGIAFVVWLFVLFWVGAAQGGPISFTGTGAYQHSEDEGDSSRLSQSTTIDLEQPLTPVMSLEENVRYSTTFKEGNDTEAVTPSLDLEVLNDLFYFDLSGTANKLRNSERSDLTSNTWQGRLNSNWEKELWPVLQFNYGGSNTGDDESPSRIDSRSTFSGFNIDWDLLLAKIYYNIDLNESDNFVANSNDKSTNHLARFTTDKSFWQNRGNVSFLGQYTRNSQDFTTRIDATGSALVPVRITEARAGWDNVDVDLEPDWDDLVTAFPTVVHNQRYNVAIQVDRQQVNAIYLYTDTDLFETGRVHLFEWTVFFSNDGTTWTSLTPSPAPVYNSILQRFELEIPEVRARYVMLVETDIPTVTDFNITRVEAFRRVTGEAGQKFSSETDSFNYLGDTNLRFRITPELQWTYNLILEEGETALEYDTERTYNSTSFIWTPTEILTSTFSASESREDPGFEDEELTRFYSVNVSSLLLPTLDMNVGVTRNDNYEADVKTDTSYNYNLFLTALIFPDLTSNLDLAYITDYDELEDSVTQDFNSTLKFTARVNPELTVDLTERYTTSNIEDSDFTAASIISASWRPSDILSLQVGGGREWESEETFPYTYFFSLTVAPTYKTQVNLSYDHSDGADDYNATYNWTINQIFSLHAYCLYVEEDESEFAYGGQLVIRY
jgi:hypothetical protein